MRRNLFFILSVSPFFLYGQETIKVTNKYEVYNVLKSDKSVRHGSYSSLGCDGLPEGSGFYHQGLKDSIWDSPFYKGSYKKGEKVGIWSYYDFYRVLSEVYNHSAYELLYFKVNEADSHKLYKIVNGLDTIQVELDQPPLLLGRDLAILETLIGQKSLLKKTIKKGDSGEVYFRFFVDTFGNLSELIMTKGTGTSFDKVALLCLNEMKKEWLPGRMNGKSVTTEVKSVVNYKIERRRFHIRKNASVTIGFF